MRCLAVCTHIPRKIWTLLPMLSFLIFYGCASGSTSTGSGTPSHVNFATASLPDGTVGTPYSASLVATGGVPPYKWSIAGGTLPDGLSLAASTGALSGVPTKAVDSLSLTFQVLDTDNDIDGGTLTLRIKDPTKSVSITTTSLANGQVNTAYSATLGATGGTAPYTWSLTSGTLPAGLSLNAATGAIAGKPTAVVSSSPLTFKVTDASSPALSASVNLTLTITAAGATLSITTTSLANGQVGKAYSATLGATGGTAPYTWSLTSGTLPAGLSFNAATGAITGTPTAAVTNTPLSFQVVDSSNPNLTQSANLTLTILAGGSITVSISPKRAGLAVKQTFSLTATTNDGAGVTWSVSPSGGSFNPVTTLNGANVIFTAPTTAGVYTITATSVTDVTKSNSITIGVTDLVGVSTYHNNLSRDGVNSQEYALTTSNVNTSAFGKLFTCTADAAIYAQPLWVPNVSISGGTHNVIVAATMRDSVYVYDADANPCVTYWHQQLIPSGETFGSYGDLNSSDIYPDVGILGTPVIDPGTNTIYAATKTKTSSGTYHQRLHALSLVDGSERANSPADIDSSISVPGNCEGGSTIAFNTKTENQRPGLALVNGVVYITWASHGDTDPYHGWIVGYDASTLARTTVFNTSPKAAEGLGYCRAGIWMSGGAPAADSSNNLYVITGNGIFDGVSAFGDSILRLSTPSGLTLTDWFTPHNQLNLDGNDSDVGSGGAAILVDQPTGPHPQLLIGGGKEGILYLLDRTNLGKFNSSSDAVVQSLNVGAGSFSTPAFWQNTLYYFGAGGTGKAFTFIPSLSTFNATAASATTASFSFPGSSPSISSNGAASGIVWTIDAHVYGTYDGGSRAAAPTVLHAFDATNLGNEFWNSSMVAGDVAGNAVKFTVPTVANGKVYVGTRGGDTTQGSGSPLGEIDVYGLKPN